MMRELFNRPLAGLTRKDVDGVVDRGECESQYLEFKEIPPGKAETWQKASLDLAAEMVAFANADGGVLLLGVKDQDNRAVGVELITEAEKVADSLHRSFASTIDPYPVGLEVRAVVYSDDGKGIIVARVPASPEAPHGVKDKRRYHVTVRRGEEAKTLDMRDIQMHTLETRRRTNEAEQRLEARRTAFQKLGFWEQGTPLSAGYRITVTPARAVYQVPDLMANSTDKRILKGFSWKVNAENRSPFKVETLFHRALKGERRPCLRGMIASKSDGRPGLISLATFENGTVDVVRAPIEHPPTLKNHLLLGDFLGAVELASILREKAGAGRAELMIDVEMTTIGPSAKHHDPTAIDLMLDATVPDAMPEDPAEVSTPLRFPRYTVVESEDMSRVASEFWRDLCSVAGVTGIPAVEKVELIQR